MQAIAREVNLSETTFPTVTGAGAYSMRIFTPRVRDPLRRPPLARDRVGAGARAVATDDAGHDGHRGGHRRRGGDEPTRSRHHRGRPRRCRRRPRPPGRRGRLPVGRRGTAHVLVPTTHPLDELAPELTAVARVAARAGGISLCAFRRVDDRTLHVRVFVPGAGVPEDPGTGSAAGPIALLARRRWGTDVDVVIRQGDEIGRPCRIDAHAEEGAIRVGGRVTACAEGNFVG